MQLSRAAASWQLTACFIFRAGRYRHALAGGKGELEAKLLRGIVENGWMLPIPLGVEEIALTRSKPIMLHKEILAGIPE